MMLIVSIYRIAGVMKMSDQTSSTNKTVSKKSSKKTASTKKAPPSRAAADKTEAVAKPVLAVSPIDPNIVPTIQAIVEEMSSDRESRDKQLASLISEVRDGFSILTNKSGQQGEEREKEMTGLYQSLKNVFGNIKDNNSEKEELNLNIFKSLSDSITKDHDQTLIEIQEQGKLQDKKIELMTTMLEQRTKRNRLIAVPGVILAITGIFYMFYVVSIMESAMTSMSQDMHLMQASVGDMTGKIDTISQNTTAMNTNIQQLNGNILQVSRDLNVMTRNVAPAMQGMRTMMPWSP